MPLLPLADDHNGAATIYTESVLYACSLFNIRLPRNMKFCFLEFEIEGAEQYHTEGGGARILIRLRDSNTVHCLQNQVNKDCCGILWLWEKSSTKGIFVKKWSLTPQAFHALFWVEGSPFLDEVNMNTIPIESFLWLLYTFTWNLGASALFWKRTVTYILVQVIPSCGCVVLGTQL